MCPSLRIAINAAAQHVTLVHPMPFSVVASRRETKRQELGLGGEPSIAAGQPTFGGMGVLRAEDESDIDYIELGPAKMLLTRRFAGSALIELGNDTMPLAQ